MWRAHASSAWHALVQDASTSGRRGLRVLDGPGGRGSSLWPFVHVLWAAADLRLLGEDVPIDALAEGLGGFRRGEAYAATPRERRRYFDDNAWLGLAALRLAEATGDTAWTELARRLAVFVASGEHPQGGIRWREGSESRNTCSTASSAWLGATAAIPDGDTRAARWIDWLERTLERPDRLFADAIDGDRIDTHAWTYNQGAVIAARVALGRTDAGLADAVIQHWDAERLWRESPPFLAIAARALLASPAHRDRARTWLDPHLERLVRDARDPATGWYVRGGLGAYDGKPTIDQAAVAQLFALRAGV
jgi:hypothetical protein